MKRVVLTAMCIALAGNVWGSSHKILNIAEPSKWNQSMQGEHLQREAHIEGLPLWFMGDHMIGEHMKYPHATLPALPSELEPPSLEVPSMPKVLQTAQVELVELPVYIISVSSLQVDNGSQIRFHNGNMRYKFDIATKEVWASVMNGTSMAWRLVRMDSPNTKEAMNQIFREATGRQFI